MTLVRTILAYSPSNLVPAVMAVVTISVFTRLMPPHEFGYYTFAQSCILFGQTVAFFGLQMAVTRYAMRGESVRSGMVATAYRGLALCAIPACVVFAAAIPFIGDPSLRLVLWWTVPILALRGAVIVNLTFHRRALSMVRYNLIECGQPVIGFVVALPLVLHFGLGGEGLILGMLAGAALAVVFDAALFRRGFGRPDWALGRELLHYGAPLTLGFGISSVGTYADRVFLLNFVGLTAVGIYGIAYGLVDRVISIVFVSVNLGAFPLALAVMDRDGPDAARRQMLQTATVLLASALPAALGFASLSTSISGILVGTDYRQGVSQVIPLLAVSLMMRGLAVHYFDHAFHLGRKTNLTLLTIVPTAAVNLGLNAVLIPGLGIMGALYASLGTQATALALDVIVGRRVFVVWFPWGQFTRVLAASLTMFAAMVWLPAMPSLLGVTLKVVLGIAIYGAGALLLDIADIRRNLRLRLRDWYGAAASRRPN